MEGSAEPVSRTAGYRCAVSGAWAENPPATADLPPGLLHSGPHGISPSTRRGVVDGLKGRRGANLPKGAWLFRGARRSRPAQNAVACHQTGRGSAP
jgi:hypothetical protein